MNMNPKNFWEKSLKSGEWTKRLEQLAQELNNLAQNLANQGQLARQPVPIPVRSGRGSSRGLHPRNLDSFGSFFGHREPFFKSRGRSFARFFLSSHRQGMSDWLMQYMQFMRGSQSRFAPLFSNHMIGFGGLLQLPYFARLFLSGATNEALNATTMSRLSYANHGRAFAMGSGAGVFLASGCIFTHLFVNLQTSKKRCLSNMLSAVRSYHSYRRYNYNHYHRYHNFYGHHDWGCGFKHHLKFSKYRNLFSRRFHSSQFWWKYKPAFFSIRDQIFNTSRFGRNGFMFLNFTQVKFPLGFEGKTTQLVRSLSQLKCLLFGTNCHHYDHHDIKPKEKFSKPSNFVKVDAAKAPKNHTVALKFPKSVVSFSLTPTFHHITLQMARTDSSATVEEKIEADQLINGSYIEFSIFAAVGSTFSHETVLSEETIDEVLEDLDILIQRIQTLKEDLEKIFELGALPIKFIKSRMVLRVYFPNCEPEKLQKLCQEKNVMGGTIYEDLEHLGDAVVGKSRRGSVSSTAATPPPPTTIAREPLHAREGDYSEPVHALTAGHIGIINQLESFPSDVLSTFDNSSTVSTDLTNDIISLDPLSNEEIVRIEDGAFGTTPLGHAMHLESVPVSIVDSYSDEYYWVSST